VNNLVQFVSIKKEIKSLAKKGYRYCIIDVLNVSVNMAIISLCKRLNLKLIGIVTDIPKLISSDEKSMFVKATDFIIEKCDGYVLLTEQMNDFFNIDRKKPFAVIEGQIDDDVQTDQDEKHSPCEKKICMYAGSLEIVNGLKYMIEGFLKADIPDLELYLYGNGGYRERIKQICAENRSIKYFGNRYVDEVVEAQKKADLLINPRPTDQEFVKYSFPSKNMEYMASGTPLLTTRLPGMPKEYDDHVYFIEMETAEGFADALRNVFSLSSDERRKKGLEAQEVVVENKKGSMQVKKVADIIKRIEEKEI
jgi:glycosyltransferase involved in cell wall biosynthesis